MVQTSFLLICYIFNKYVAPTVEFLNQIFMVLIKPFCDLMSEHRDFWAQGSCGRNLAMEFAPKWRNGELFPWLLGVYRSTKHVKFPNDVNH